MIVIGLCIIVSHDEQQSLQAERCVPVEACQREEEEEASCGFKFKSIYRLFHNLIFF